ncbi:MAG: twin-arginine translocase subunit TatC [Verrucomicrobiota bacterium]
MPPPDKKPDVMLKGAFEKLFKIREEAGRARPGADDGFDPHEKPFLDHLEDLRVTLFRIILTLAIATAGAFVFHTQIFELVQLPAKRVFVTEGVTLWERTEFITLSPPEFIVLMLKVSLFAGIIVSFPFTVYFLFQFLLPGLRQAEKRAIIPGALIGFMLFLLGVSFAFFLAAPIALKFFYEFENKRISNLDPQAVAQSKPVAEFQLIGIDGRVIRPLGAEDESDTPGDEETLESESSPVEQVEGEAEAVEPENPLPPELREQVRDYVVGMFATLDGDKLSLRYDETREKIIILETKGGSSIYRIGEYIKFITRLVLVFGISFQLPVVVTILVKLELLTARVMRATRTYAWIIIMVSAALLTPPDILTLGMLAGPMVILYEICIVIATVIERGRARKERREEEARRARLERLYSTPSDELSEDEKEELHREEIERYEKDHADLYADEHHETIARDGLHGDDHDESWHDDHHGDPYHDDPYHHGEHDEWHDPHQDEEQHEPVQDWPDREAEAEKSESVDDEAIAAEPDQITESEVADAHDSEQAPDDWGDEECAPSGPVIDLNSATMEEIMTLPGIGPKLAEVIINHRPYRSFDEVEEVPGLGPEKLNAMMDRLMLG